MTDRLTPIDRLRLFANDPDVFPFDRDDAEEALTAFDALGAALVQIRDIDVRPFEGTPPDLREQINACPECQRYKDHPIQRGICDEHRRPQYARERHDAHEQSILGYRCSSIARDALNAITD